MSKYDTIKMNSLNGVNVGNHVKIVDRLPHVCESDDPRCMGVVIKSHWGKSVIKVCRYEEYDVPKYLIDKLLVWLDGNCTGRSIMFTSKYVFDHNGDASRAINFLKEYLSVHDNVQLGDYIVTWWSGQRTSPAKFIARRINNE